MKRFFASVLPAFLLAVSVGQIYAFTNFSSEIASYIGETQQAVQFAFSLGIFFLGMGAAFFGKIVEKNIHRSTMIGMALFITGLAVTSVGIYFKSLWSIYLGYGFLLGLGTGVIYITPVKTMMLWFPDNKAIAAAVPIISFGLGSTLSTIIYKGCCGIGGLYDLFNVATDSKGMFFVMMSFAVIYLVTMGIASTMLRKPDAANNADIVNPKISSFSYVRLLGDRFFLQSWLFMFLNISAGLCLIPLAKQMMDAPDIGYRASTITLVIGLCGLMNGGGRFFFAWWSDRLTIRKHILIYISLISFLTMAVSLKFAVVIGIALLIINACYGAGFSVIPGILADHYGMSDISKIHGAVLSAWGVAGLVGNQAALYVGSNFGGYKAVISMLIIVYLLNMLNSGYMLKKHER